MCLLTRAVHGPNLIVILNRILFSMHFNLTPRYKHQVEEIFSNFVLFLLGTEVLLFSLMI